MWGSNNRVRGISEAQGPHTTVWSPQTTGDGFQPGSYSINCNPQMYNVSKACCAGPKTNRKTQIRYGGQSMYVNYDC